MTRTTVCVICRGSGHQVGNPYRTCGACLCGWNYKDDAPQVTHEYFRWVVMNTRGYIRSEHKTEAEGIKGMGQIGYLMGDRLVKMKLVIA